MHANYRHTLPALALSLVLGACSQPEEPKQPASPPAEAPAQPTTSAAAPAPAQSPLLQEGESFRVASAEAESAKPRVQEFFSYACPHCYTMEGFVHDWLGKKPKAIGFERVPVVFRPEWEIYAKAYYLGEELGLLERSHEAVFKRVHDENKPFQNEAELVEFFVALGAEREAVTGVLAGPRLAERVAEAKALTARYQIGSTPSFVVNEKYYTDARMGGERLGEVMDALALRNKPAIFQ